MTKKPEAGSAVGYGRPPAHSRFKPGRSGNPKGRPKGSRSLRGIAMRLLDEIVAVNRGGRVVKRTFREVIAQRLLGDAARGDAKAIQVILALEGRSEDGEAAGEEMLTAADRALLERGMARRIARRNLGEKS
ncbi:MAG: hypothetical protein FJZ01_21650 [Candidatus Sericytochromatia bacterium]|nr:hypothetical protein [Candidatus Tanganyikabacteria bacterium]